MNNSDNNNNNNSSKVVDDRDLHLVVVVDEARFKVSEKYPNKQENSFSEKLLLALLNIVAYTFI